MSTPTVNRKERERKKEKVYSVPALERAFDILDIIRTSGLGRTVSELSSLLNLPYSTAFYLLKTMERYGFVRRDGESKRFYLGSKLMSYQAAISQLSDLQIRDACSPFLIQLVDRFALTAHTAIRDGGEAVYIDRRETPGYIKINTWIGQHIQLHCTAVGKALLLLSPPEEVSEILGGGPLPRFTDRTITRVKDLIRHLESCRHIGYTTDDREAEMEGACVAAPILGSENKVVAAVGVSGTIYQLPPARMSEVGEQVCLIGKQISQQLGLAGEYPGT